VNCGLVFWNNAAMAKLGLFEKIAEVFGKCRGCFAGEQALVALSAAAYDIPLLELSDAYNFNFFEDSLREDRLLRKQVRRGEYDDICIVHYVWCKPWLREDNPSAVKAHFINAWRGFVLDELRDSAHDLFEDLSVIRFDQLAYQYRNLTNIRGHIERISSECEWRGRRLVWKLRHFGVRG
jgi:lipopolysaccharide biosynthesis glycosyltransferase